MPTSIVVIALSAALLHAVWNAIIKSGGDRLMVLATVNFVSTLIAGALLPFVGIPAPESWFYVVLSVILHTGYYFSLLKAYQHGDLSIVYPLARGAAPLLVTMGAALFAGEFLPLATIAGVLMACAGILALAFENGAPWKQPSNAIRYALITSLWISAYTVTDGMGVRESGNALAYIAWLFFLDGIPIALFALYARQGKVKAFLTGNWRYYLPGGFASFTAYALIIYAMSLGAMGAVSALRETSVIFAAIIGSWVLKESFGLHRIAAIGLVAAGVTVMNFTA